MTKSKYGNKSDIAVTLNLIAERVRENKFTKSLLFNSCGKEFISLPAVKSFLKNMLEHAVKCVTFSLIFIRTEKEVDGSPVAFIRTPERAIEMDFAYFLTAEPHAMVVPRPGEEPRLFAFIRPFQSSVRNYLFEYIDC